MILVDPDLDPDAAPQASTTKRAPSTASSPIDRRDRVPSARSLARFLGEAQLAVRHRGQVSVLLTTDAKIRRLNRQFRGQNKVTDVLSFPAPEVVAQEVAGDLAISVPTARRQAREQRHALAIELKVLILHGLLHLAGYDHERDDGKMARRERRLREQLGLPKGLIERVANSTRAAKAARKAGPSMARPLAEDDTSVRRRRSPRGRRA
jgi:probable rRNA maturation factor